ncbi:MAG: haloacid dehalogenase type II [Pseudomonadales bacterium]|nr:haloacid dehalogenase type II [Pseudomonadales bacterium]
MPSTIGFDIYGTLINTDGVVTTLQEFMGAEAGVFAQTWRSKQLEYTFRRGLMQNYRDFAVCTSQALDYSCLAHGQRLSVEQKKELLAVYRRLPAFDDVQDGLSRLQAQQHRLFAFSNGSAEAVRALLDSAGISAFFAGVVSTEDLRSFKPNPAVYSHFLRQSGACGSNAWLVSSNPFDVIGAISAGMKAAWLKRSPKAIYDPWETEPTLTIGSLAELSEQVL